MQVTMLGGLMLLVALALPAAAAVTIGNVEGRSAVSLTGTWRTIVDPYDVGSQGYHAQPLADGFFLARPPKDETDLVEYDFDRSPTLQVPGDWNTQRESLLYYEGTLWYMRRFEARPQPGRRAVLWFGAANYMASVWLNGQPLGDHEGGFTPFAFEATRTLRAGDEHARRTRQQSAPRRGRADLEYRLVELRRPDPRGPAARPPGDVHRRLRRAARTRRLVACGRLGAARRAASRAEGDRQHPRGRALDQRHDRRPGSGGLLLPGPADALVTRDAEALSGRAARRDRSGPGGDRLPHHRDARQRDPAQRPPALPARHLLSRRGALPLGARLQPRGRAHAVGLGEGAGRERHPPGPLSPQLPHDARGRSAGVAGVVRDPSVLDHTLGRRRDLRQRPPAARRDDRARPQPRLGGPLVGGQRDADHRLTTAFLGRLIDRARSWTPRGWSRGPRASLRGRHDADDRRSAGGQARRRGLQRIHRLVRRPAREGRRAGAGRWPTTSR